MLQSIVAKFQNLPKDCFKLMVQEYSLPEEKEFHEPYPQNAAPRLTALNYFFVQTPPDQNGPTPVHISIADSRRRIREVHYDRGTIANNMDIEAKEMADCKKRYESFLKSEHLKGKIYAYQLSQLGFFFVGDRNAVGKLRCSFCRRTIHMFVTEEIRLFSKKNSIVALSHYYIAIHIFQLHVHFL